MACSTSRRNCLTAQRFDGAIVYGQFVSYTCLPGFSTDLRSKSKMKSQLTCKEDGFVPAVSEGCLLVLGQVGSQTRPFDSSVCWVRVSVAVVGSAFNWMALGSRIKYSCPVGITVTGRTSDSSTLSAVCAVFWQLLVPTSLELRSTFCSAPCRHASYGQSLIYTCEPGYVMSDGSTTFERECEGSGHLPPVHQCRTSSIFVASYLLVLHFAHNGEKRCLCFQQASCRD